MNRKERRFAERSPYIQVWNQDTGRWERRLKKDMERLKAERLKATSKTSDLKEPHA
jgi:hypothetical protein